MAEYLQLPDAPNPEARPGDGPILEQGQADEVDPLQDLKDDDTKPPEKTEQQLKVETFMRIMRDQFRESADATDKVRRRIAQDRRFAGGEDHWVVNGKDLKQERHNHGRPAHTINRIPGFVKQVTNGIREGRMAIEYIPVDDEADPDKAEVFQGLARHVEQNSDADVAYETAMEHQVEAGLGWFYARTDYVHDGTDEQEIFIDRVRNPLTVYWDPSCQKFDFSDARYLFRVEEMPLSTYQRLYPRAPIASLNEFSSVGDTSYSHWRIADKVRVAEYYYIEHVDKRLVILMPEPQPMQPGQPAPTPPDPSTFKRALFEDLQPEQQRLVVTELRDGKVEPFVLRTVKVPVVMWAKVNGLGIIEGNEDRTAGRRIAGRYIPFCPVIGDERDNDGEVDYRGMVRDLRDAQQMVNFWQTAITEAIALAPKSPYTITAGQIAGFEAIWDQANLKAFAYLPYNAEDINGHLTPPPQRNVLEPAIQAMVMALQIAENHLRALAGFYDVDPSESRKSEKSGKAILARQQQGERGNSNYHGNLSRSIRHMGRILLYMFPEVYDTARVKRIVGADENEKHVMVYAGPKNKPATPPKMGKKKLEMFDLSAGRYDVRTTVGPSYPTRRQEGFDKLMELSKVNPMVGQAGADIIIGMVDAPGARELQKRMQKVPQIAELMDENTEDPELMVAKLQAQMEKMGQVYDLLAQEVKSKTAYIEGEQAKLDAQERMKLLEIQSKEAIEAQKLQVQILIARMTGEAKEGQIKVQAELDRLGRAIELGFEHRHQVQMSQIEATRAQEQTALEASLAAQDAGPAGGGQPTGGAQA